MGIIYEPKGKAKEYCDLAANLYRGCGHGCTYCWAPEIFFVTKEDFRKAVPRKNVLALLEKEAPLYSGQETQLCFTCDPYQPVDEELQITRQAIKILHRNNVTVRLLTKGGLRSLRDFDLLTANPEKSIYGATLTFIRDDPSKEYEPYAALPAERFQALEVAHKDGIKTWVSLEPIIDPSQTLKIIEATHKFVDEYKVGKWNYDPRAEKINWKEFGLKAVELLKNLGKKFYIKKDLAKEMG